MDFDFSTETITPDNTLVLTIGGTGGLEVPVGTTAQRPVTNLVNGTVRYNTDLNVLDAYVNNAWTFFNTGPTTITLVGDVTGSGVSPVTTTLATVNSNVGTFASVTVNGKGLVTAAANLSGDATTSGSVLTLATVNSSPQTDQFRKITVNGKGLVTATSAVVAADITTALGYTPVNKAGDSVTGNLTFTGGATITGLPTPTAGTDAANKNYVDAATSGLSWKTAVRLATTAAGTLATSFANGQTIDGNTLVTGDRILIKNQATATENGIYIVAASGAPTRATDANTGASLVAATVYVDQGTVNADTGWTQTANAPITVGSTNITWVQFSGNGAYTAGTGLTLTGNQFSLTSPVAVNLGGTGTSTLPTAGQVVYSAAGTSYAPTNLNTIAVTTFSGGTTGLTPSAATNGAVTLGGTLIAANGGTGFSSYAVGDLLYADTTSTLAKLADVAAGSYLRSGGVSTAPVWSTTTLPNSATTGDLLVASATNTYTNLADVATGNVLISGGVGVVPSWGKVSLTTAVSGVLPVANGGTNLSTAPTNGQLLIGNGTGYTLATITPTTNQTTVTNGAGTITIGVPTTFVAPGSIAATTTLTAGTGLTVTSGGALISAGGVTVSSLTANSFLYSGTAGLLTTTAAPTNGQILIGSTGAAPVLGTITGSAGVTVTTGAGTIAISGPKLYTENPSTPTTPTAAGTNAVAIGSGATAPTTNSVGIGNGSAAGAANFMAIANGKFATNGDAQTEIVVLRNITTNATPATLFVDGASQLLTIPANSAWTYNIQVVGRRTDATGGYAMYTFTGGVVKDATNGSTVLPGSTKSTIFESNGPWNAALSADTTNGALTITVTGEAAKTIRWVATVWLTQVSN